MRIINFKVEEFRSLKSVEWKPGALNVLIGPNGSGKSNLLSLLEMLAEAAKGNLRDYIQSQGGMAPIVWDGEAERIQVALVFSGIGTETDGAVSGSRYLLSMERLGSTSGYRIDAEKFCSIRDGVDNMAPDLERDVSSFAVRDEVLTGRKLDGALNKEETVLSMADSPSLDGTALCDCRSAMSSWCVVEPLDTRRNSPVRQATVARYEPMPKANGSNLISFLHTTYAGNRVFKSQVDLAMRAAFGDEFETLLFPPDASSRIELRIRWKSLTTACPSADLSDATLRFLHLIAILANPEPPALLAIDKPETGLHPSMLPIVAEYGISAASRTQVVFTTHSPEFLDAFRDDPPTITVAKLFDGATVLRTLESDNLAHWLKEYTLGELFRSGQLEFDA